MSKCEWFALCDRQAVGTVTHPILGSVPTCQRCADKLELDLQPYERCHDDRGCGEAPCVCRDNAADAVQAIYDADGGIDRLYELESEED